MPARDAHHNAVRNSLIKEGWLITDDPFVIVFKGLRLYADLGAERVIAAERGTHRIVVEVKVFSGLSPVTELEKTVGQYGIYRTALKRTEPERKLYLAVPEDIYQDFFLRDAVQDIVYRNC